MPEKSIGGRSAKRLYVVAAALLLSAVAVAAWLGSDDSRPDLSVRRVTPHPGAGARDPVAGGVVRVAALAEPNEPRDDYVGSRACAECHAEISRVYAAHPMGRSLAAVSEASPIEDYADATTVTPPSGNRKYYVEKTDASVEHHEVMFDAAGEVLYDQGVPVRYALGSGRRGRAYLIDRAGLLFLSSLNWYSTKRCWDLAPGYRPEAHPRFERRAIDACLECHSGRLAYDRDAPNRYRDPPFVEQSIGCERCHGPGKAHVDRWRQKKSAPEAVDDIVNPAKLDVARREAVCNQCHLQGEDRVPLYGRTHHDFRPGDRLEDVWAVFVAGTRVDDADSTTRAVSHVEQMRSSRCYVASEGRLGCTSCHDPHSTPSPGERTAFYDAKCLDCHAGRGCSLPEPERSEGSASGSCVACHMPPLPTSDVPHTSASDHRIVRRATTADSPSPAAASRNAMLPELFDAAAERLPATELRRARGLMLVRRAEKNQSTAEAYEAESLLRPIAAAMPEDVDVIEALGTASLVQHRYSEAADRWRRCLELDPDRETVLVALAKVCHESGLLEEGVAALDRLFVFNPWLSELQGRQAHMLGQLGRFEQAVAAAQRAIELNPMLRQVYGWLAEAYRLQGDLERGDHYRRLYERMPENPR